MQRTHTLNSRFIYAYRILLTQTNSYFTRDTMICRSLQLHGYANNFIAESFCIFSLIYFSWIRCVKHAYCAMKQSACDGCQLRLSSRISKRAVYRPIIQQSDSHSRTDDFQQQHALCFVYTRYVCFKIRQATIARSAIVACHVSCGLSGAMQISFIIVQYWLIRLELIQAVLTVPTVMF